MKHGFLIAFIRANPCSSVAQKRSRLDVRKRQTKSPRRLSSDRRSGAPEYGSAHKEPRMDTDETRIPERLHPCQSVFIRGPETVQLDVRKRQIKSQRRLSSNRRSGRPLLPPRRRA